MSFMLIGFTGTISQQARGAKKNKRGTFIGKDEGTSQTSPCGSRMQQGKIQRKGQQNAY